MNTSKKSVALAAAVVVGSLGAGFAGAQTCTYYNGFGNASGGLSDLGSCNGGGECYGQSCDAGLFFSWHQDCYGSTPSQICS